MTCGKSQPQSDVEPMHCTFGLLKCVVMGLSRSVSALTDKSGASLRHSLRSIGFDVPA
jgi:hypothetical protein